MQNIQINKIMNAWIVVTIALRIKTKSGQQVINNLTKNNTIKDLKEILSNLSSIPVNRLHVLSGFPPKSFDIKNDDLDLGDSFDVSNFYQLVKD